MVAETSCQNSGGPHGLINPTRMLAPRAARVVAASAAGRTRPHNHDEPNLSALRRERRSRSAPAAAWVVFLIRSYQRAARVRAILVLVHGPRFDRHDLARGFCAAPLHICGTINGHLEGLPRPRCWPAGVLAVCRRVTVLYRLYRPNAPDNDCANPPVTGTADGFASRASAITSIPRGRAPNTLPQFLLAADGPASTPRRRNFGRGEARG